MVGDPIGDMIIQIKNASAVGKECVSIPYSRLKAEVAKSLLQSGYIKGFTKKSKKIRKFIEIELLYNDGTPKITDLKRVSKPSRRIYSRAKVLFKRGRGHSILSTPKGVITDEQARKANVGGEVLFNIW